MKKSIIIIVTVLIAIYSQVISGSGSNKNSPDEHRVNINLENSRIYLTTNNVGEQSYAGVTAGELVLDDTEIKSGSFTIDLKSGNKSDSRVGLKIRKVSKLPITRTEQGDIKFTHKIEGELTIKGETKPVSFNASVNMLKGKVVASSDNFRIDGDTSLKFDLVTN